MQRMEEKVEDILSVLIRMADYLHKAAGEAGSYKQECGELKKQAGELVVALRNVARLAGSDGMGRLYRRPAMRMLQELEKSLRKALALVAKCTGNGFFRRMITITSAHDFKRVAVFLDSGIGDLTWLLHASSTGKAVGLPPIVASADPMLGFIWGHIALLQRGTEQERTDAAHSLASVAQDNDRNGKIIVEEDGVPPLLKLLSDGSPMAQETAAKTLALLARDADRVRKIVSLGAVPVFVKCLTQSPMKVQAKVAHALAQMLFFDPDSQEDFYQHRVIKPLVSLLAFETLDEPSKVESKPVSMHSLVETSIAANKASVLSPELQKEKCKALEGDTAKKVSVDDSKSLQKISEDQKLVKASRGGTLGPWEANRKERGKEDLEVKLELKTEAARALWQLAKGNPTTSRSITETRALLCFAKLMESGKDELQRNAVMAVMEIAAVAEVDPVLRKAAFKMSSLAAMAVVEQLLRLVECRDPCLQAPCIKAIGCLSRVFPARETRIVKLLVRQLEVYDGREEVVTEALIALIKFVSTDNHLHQQHSKAILEASGTPHLVQLIWFGKGQAQVSGVILMCYLALHVGESNFLADADALKVLEWVSSKSSLVQDPMVQKLLPQAINRLEIYQGKGIPHHTAAHYMGSSPHRHF